MNLVEAPRKLGADSVFSDSPESAAIRLRMEEVRRDLDEGVQEIVEGARDMGDWRSYVGSHPWICCGAAFVVGYLIVPRRPGETLARLAGQGRALVSSLRPGNTGGLLLPLVGNLVMQGISSLAMQQADRLFAKQDPNPLRGSPA